MLHELASSNGRYFCWWLFWIKSQTTKDIFVRVTEKIHKVLSIQQAFDAYLQIAMEGGFGIQKLQIK